MAQTDTAVNPLAFTVRPAMGNGIGHLLQDNWHHMLAIHI
jgi:hypothetical protein